MPRIQALKNLVILVAVKVVVDPAAKVLAVEVPVMQRKRMPGVAGAITPVAPVKTVTVLVTAKLQKLSIMLIK